MVSKQEVFFFFKKLNHQSSRLVMKLRKICGVNQGTAGLIREWIVVISVGNLWGPLV